MAAQLEIPALVTTRAKLLRDLTVLAAEIERGRIVKLEDPNYALSAKAAQTINCFLDSVFNDDRRHDCALGANLPDSSAQTADEILWAEALEPEVWDSELTFWQGLADHPSVFSQYLMPPPN
ncbi:hypothetical protein CGMCC3_g9207 [Colletotrichum fructicola]|nr:uncharacterized protein CGMCC3_g9207 [Colletotrichum fructicola]KAE9574611.1 hypothetical protein CGMCC3_g9207 [Colletotrichum fructicola]